MNISADWYTGLFHDCLLSLCTGNCPWRNCLVDDGIAKRSRQYQFGKFVVCSEILFVRLIAILIIYVFYKSSLQNELALMGTCRFTWGNSTVGESIEVKYRRPWFYWLWWVTLTGESVSERKLIFPQTIVDHLHEKGKGLWQYKMRRHSKFSFSPLFPFCFAMKRCPIAAIIAGSIAISAALFFKQLFSHSGMNVCPIFEGCLTDCTLCMGHLVWYQ